MDEPLSIYAIIVLLRYICPIIFFKQSKLSINKLRLVKMANTLNRGGMGDVIIDLLISTNFVYLLSTEKMLGEAIAVRSSGLTIF